MQSMHLALFKMQEKLNNDAETSYIIYWLGSKQVTHSPLILFSLNSNLKFDTTKISKLKHDEIKSENWRADMELTWSLNNKTWYPKKRCTCLPFTNISQHAERKIPLYLQHQQRYRYCRIQGQKMGQCQLKNLTSILTMSHL